MRENGVKVLTVRDILSYGVEDHIGARVELEDLAMKVHPGGGPLCAPTCSCSPVTMPECECGCVCVGWGEGGGACAGCRVLQPIEAFRRRMNVSSGSHGVLLDGTRLMHSWPVPGHHGPLTAEHLCGGKCQLGASDCSNFDGSWAWCDCCLMHFAVQSF